MKNKNAHINNTKIIELKIRKMAVWNKVTSLKVNISLNKLRHILVKRIWIDYITFSQTYLALSKNLDVMDVKAAEEGAVDAKKSGGVLQHIKSSAAGKGGDISESNKIVSAPPSYSSTANRVATVNPAPIVPVNNISLENKAPIAILDSAISLLSKDDTQPPLNIVLNVGGQKFESLVRNFLSAFPNSRLWRLAHAIQSDASTDDILQICDRFKRGYPGGGGKISQIRL